MNFVNFQKAVATQFKSLETSGQLFVVKTVDNDELYEAYLAAYPEGSNPIYRERSEHDCSCCKSFIRSVGGIVGFINGKMESIWSLRSPMEGEPEYQAVADAMAAKVLSLKIDNVFLTDQSTAGASFTFEQIIGGSPKKWDHFFVNIPKSYVVAKDVIGPRLGEHRATFDVMLRSLQELTMESLDTVLELIAQNSLYKGAEFQNTIKAFKTLKEKFTGDENFVWQNLNPKYRIRNTSIGTLLVDLSEGKDLESAVKSFEHMVAPANYKRPTSLITSSMVKNAKEVLEGLGLTSALQRRHAGINDLNINDVLFADRSTKLQGDVFDDLIKGVAKPAKRFDRIDEVAIETFLREVLPTVTSMELLLENRHQANMVSLIAPEDPTAGKLFKWDNLFSWTYNGNITDSDLRREVQARGGSVDGVFRFSHSWNYEERNASLMDLHVFMPGNSTRPDNRIDDNYGNLERVGWNNRNHHKSGGVQDVDYTAAAPKGYVPVENITFPTLSKMPEGVYICKIHNWNLRSPTQGGFRAEIEFGGEVFQYEVTRPLKNKEWVTVAEVTLKDGKFTIKHHLPCGQTSKTIWNLATEQFHKVRVVMNSPNYWNGQAIGNKHYFFMLDGCMNEEDTRGLFNEYLSAELTPHRKVFEVLGSKLIVPNSEKQLSGLGFSSTQRNKVQCKVEGNFTRVINIVF